MTTVKLGSYSTIRFQLLPSRILFQSSVHSLDFAVCYTCKSNTGVVIKNENTTASYSMLMYYVENNNCHNMLIINCGSIEKETLRLTCIGLGLRRLELSFLSAHIFYERHQLPVPLLKKMQNSLSLHHLV